MIILNLIVFPAAIIDIRSLMHENVYRYWSVSLPIISSLSSDKLTSLLFSVAMMHQSQINSVSPDSNPTASSKDHPNPSSSHLHQLDVPDDWMNQILRQVEKQLELMISAIPQHQLHPHKDPDPEILDSMKPEDEIMMMSQKHVFQVASALRHLSLPKSYRSSLRRIMFAVCRHILPSLNSSQLSKLPLLLSGARCWRHYDHAGFFTSFFKLTIEQGHASRMSGHQVWDEEGSWIRA